MNSHKSEKLDRTSSSARARVQLLHSLFQKRCAQAGTAVVPGERAAFTPGFLMVSQVTVKNAFQCNVYFIYLKTPASICIQSRNMKLFEHRLVGVQTILRRVLDTASPKEHASAQ